MVIVVVFCFFNILPSCPEQISVQLYTTFGEMLPLIVMHIKLLSDKSEGEGEKVKDGYRKEKDAKRDEDG